MDGLVEVLGLEELVSSELVLFCSQCRCHASSLSLVLCLVEVVEVVVVVVVETGVWPSKGGVSVRREGGMGVSGMNE